MKEYQKLSNKALRCMYVSNLILSVILVVGPIVGLVFTWGVTLWMSILFAVIGLIILETIFFPHIRYGRYRYRVTEEEIDVIEGIFWISRDVVPIERIHKIEINKGPIDRMFGLGKVIVTTAGGDVVLRFIEDEVSEEIAEHLKNRINNMVSEDEEIDPVQMEETHGDE